MTGSQFAFTVAHALAGWALCGAVMGIGLAKMTRQGALTLHAVAAPIIFGAVSFVYFTYFAFTTPLAGALTFVGIVMAMDFLVVALLIERSFAMFHSVLGTWLPFASIFAASYTVGCLTAA